MNIAIIGAGASGLYLASNLKNSKIKYTIFNKGKIGSKILASGNGRCNISNMNLSKDKYHDSELAEYIIKNYATKLYASFKDNKIYTKSDNEGRLYPISEFSESVLNAIMANVDNKAIIDDEIKHIETKNNKFYLNNQYGPFDKVIIATGTPAGMKVSRSYDYFKDLGIKLNSFNPSLSGFMLKENVKDVTGVRSKAIVSLYEGEELIHKENGEVVFKDNGISGICIMNLSSYYNHINKNNAKLKIDLLLGNEYDSYLTVLNPKMLKYVEANKLNPANLVFNIKSLYPMEFAQVSNGGIPLKDINNNLTLKVNNNVFAMGEVIDVDGLCGGFNLSFAFMCALLVKEELLNEVSNK